MLDSVSRAEEMKQVATVSAKYGLSVFISTQEEVTSHKTVLTIYSDETALKWLNKKGVHEGEYKSFFSGTTEVHIENYENASNIPETCLTYCFSTRNVDKVKNVRNDLSENGYHMSSLAHINNEYSTEWILPTVFCVCAALLLVMTFIDIQFRKKEEFVLISLGKSRYKIVIKNILTDLAFFILIFFVVYIVLNKFAYIKYMSTVLLIVCIIFLLLNSLLYAPFKPINYKEALYSSQAKSNSLSAVYVLKVVITILTVVILSSNMFLAYRNSVYIKDYELLDKSFNQYSFINLHTKQNSEINDSEETLSDVKAEIFKKYFNKGKVAMDTLSMDNGDYLCLLLNDSSILSSIITDEKIDDNYDLTLFVPEGIDIEEDFGKYDTIYKYFLFINEDYAQKNLTCNIVTYSSSKNIAYIGNSAVDSLFQMKYSDTNKPVIAFFNVDLPDKAFEEEEITPIFNDIMFFLDDDDKEDLDLYLTTINSSFGDNSSNIQITYETLEERCGQDVNTYTRITVLNTIISIFMLILDCVIIITIIKMQYQVSAMEFSLKKILGYSFFKRNRSLILLNFFSALIGITSVFLVTILFSISQWYVVIIAGGLLLILENIIILSNIIKIERSNIPAILKGGSL